MRAARLLVTDGGPAPDRGEGAAGVAARLGSSPKRRLYRGARLERVRSIEDLRSRTHRLMPRLVLEYLEGGAQEEAALRRERAAFGEWYFLPRMLRDVSERDTGAMLLGRAAAMPLAVAPTGLNGLFRRHADIALARGAAAEGVPFIQATMSNDRMEDVARTEGLRHWWQLYVFGPDEIWQELVRRAEAVGCEALVLTVNAQLFGRRDWSRRLRVTRTRPSLPAMIDAACHPRWMAHALNHGMPVFGNVIDFVPKDRRSLFESAFWIREQMPKSLSWATVARIRQRWKRPFFIKGLLHPDDIEQALDCGVDGIMLGTHGGRQLDWSVSALDMLPAARETVRDRAALYISGGIRHGADMVKARALGADAVLVGRAPLYGLCAGGAEGVARALRILRREMDNVMGQIGAAALRDLDPSLLVRTGGLP